MIKKLGELVELLKSNNFEDDYISIGVSSDNKFIIETPVECYKGDTFEKALNKAIKSLEDDICSNISYWEDLEETYRKDRQELGIGSW